MKLSERVVRTVPLQAASIRELLSQLGLGVQTGLDPDADNVVAVATFAYGDPQSPMQVCPVLWHFTS